MMVKDQLWSKSDTNPSKLGGGVPGAVGNGGSCGGRAQGAGAGSPLDRFVLREGFGQYRFLKNAGVVPPTANNTSGLTPFRRAFNAGDYLTATVPPNSGPDPRLPQINQINSSQNNLLPIGFNNMLFITLR